LDNSFVLSGSADGSIKISSGPAKGQQGDCFNDKFEGKLIEIMLKAF